MKYTLRNAVRVYSDESLHALLRLVLRTHCPYRKLVDYHVTVEVRSTKPANAKPRVKVDASGRVAIQLFLPSMTSTLNMTEVVGCLRWATMWLAGVPVSAWPAGDPPFWPAPKWFDKVQQLESWRTPPPPSADEQQELKAWALQQQIKKARQELKSATTRAKRAATSVKFWEKRAKALQREVDRADKRFLKSDHGLQASMLNELECALDAAMKDVE